MGRKLYLSLPLFLFSFLASNAQTGEVRGVVKEPDGTPVPFASVAALVGGVQVQATSADFDGNYSIKPLNPGKYDIKATAVGYSPAQKANVLVTIDNFSIVDLELTKGITTKEVVITEYVIPLIETGSPSEKRVIDREAIKEAPTRSVNALVVQAAGVYQKEEGSGINIRGSRTDGTVYYVDGIKTNQAPSVANGGIEQISVITGGIPAQYGDAVGGIITVSTRDPSNKFGGGIELATSEQLDAFGYNLAAANITGPIYRQRDENGKKKDQAIAGFFIAGEYQHDKDPNPSVIPIYRVKSDILEDVLKNPLTADPTGGFIHRASYFTLDSLEKQKYHENVAVNAYRVNGKIDIRPVKNLTLTLGGNFERTKDNEFVGTYSLMNFDNNPEKIDTRWRSFAKLTQRFTTPEGEKSSSAIRNAFYTIQVDYARTEVINQSPFHKRNTFDYGYVGKFRAYSVPFYNVTFVDDPFSNNDTLFFNQIGNFDTSFTYIPGTQNPNTSNYTTQYYELTDPLGTFGYQDNLNNVLQGGALVNGDNRSGLNVYGLWSSTGRIPNGWSINNVDQGRISASGSADIKNHNIIIGIEYEQRTERGYQVLASSLWTRMRELANQSLKLNGVDSSSATVIPGMSGGIVTMTTTYAHGKYTPFINAEGDLTRGFFENVRDKFGIAYNDTIQTDSYDPSEFNIGLFTPDELFNSGNRLISYYGYDYIGENKTNESWDLNDFFVDKDESNNHFRKIDAFRPVYMAGYIQDRFIFNDINFNIGVRVDRFDANQKVLKDPYSLYEIHKAGDQETKNIATIPDNIGDDFSVYVNNSQNATQVVGYRDGSIWYDKFGTVITDLDPLTQNGSIQPFLTNYDDYARARVNPNAFGDYEPQVTVMPRVAFSFPISDEAYFAAHYDVLTQRPQNSALIRFDPIDYLQWSQGVSGNFTNPNLRPERTTVYEINFKQKLSRSSVFSITAFYKEMRDMIQFINVDFAFPIKYTTYGNVDFGTVKGLTFNYDLRRSANVKMNLSYTLQFADGTGSSAITNSGILSQAGQTNLREIKPLDFDQRHTFVTSFDFHYGEGNGYNGPVWFNKQFFANTGLNVVFHAGSGAPYTRKSNITPTADFTTTENSRSVISGSINGSRYPWNFRIDAKLDKDFAIKTGTTSDGNARKNVYINVYLQVLNVLNTTNVTAVYAATGSPSDDGYITAPNSQSVIANQPSPQAYRDLYGVKVNNPGNYDLPRRIRLGLQVNF